MSAAAANIRRVRERQEVKREKGSTIRKEEKGEDTIKIGFWNVAGLHNKDEDFWKYIEKQDYISMIEIWVEEGTWEKIKTRMPETFNWKCQYAKREKVKGRAYGGIITEMKKNIHDIENEDMKNNMAERKMEIQGKVWRIITVYSKEMKKN